VEMRYRRDISLLADAAQVLADVGWLSNNFTALWTPWPCVIGEVIMPRGHLVQEVSVEKQGLKELLSKEWANPQDDTSGPIIIETTDLLRPQRATTHLYVVWDAWRDLTQRERSEMIMDVYEAVRGRNFALNVTVAMGLTPEEAKRMNIRYEVEPHDSQPVP
jgi:hypothetical protein